MTIKTKVRKIGNSYGIILPKEVLKTMHVEEGSVLYLTEAPDESINVAPEKIGFEEKMKLTDEFMDQYRNALRELAK